MSHCVRVLGISLKAVYQTSRQFDWLNSSIRKQNDCCKQHLYCPNLNRNEIVCAKQTIVDIIRIVRNWKQIKHYESLFVCPIFNVWIEHTGISLHSIWRRSFQRWMWQEFFSNFSNKFINYHTFVCLLVVFLSSREYFHYYGATKTIRLLKCSKITNDL